MVVLFPPFIYFSTLHWASQLAFKVRMHILCSAIRPINLCIERVILSFHLNGIASKRVRHAKYWNSNFPPSRAVPFLSESALGATIQENEDPRTLSLLASLAMYSHKPPTLLCSTFLLHTSDTRPSCGFWPCNP